MVHSLYFEDMLCLFASRNTAGETPELLQMLETGKAVLSVLGGVTTALGITGIFGI